MEKPSNFSKKFIIKKNVNRYLGGNSYGSFYYFTAHLFNFGFFQFLQCKFNLVSFSLCLLFFLKKHKIFGIFLVK